MAFFIAHYCAQFAMHQTFAWTDSAQEKAPSLSLKLHVASCQP